MIVKISIIGIIVKIGEENRALWREVLDMLGNRSWDQQMPKNIQINLVIKNFIAEFRIIREEKCELSTILQEKQEGWKELSIFKHTNREQTPVQFGG
mgnify:FL=1